MSCSLFVSFALLNGASRLQDEFFRIWSELGSLLTGPMPFFFFLKIIDLFVYPYYGYDFDVESDIDWLFVSIFNNFVNMYVDRFTPLLGILQDCDFMTELVEKIGYCIDCTLSIILDRASAKCH